MSSSYILTLECADQQGIVASVAGGIARLGGNILSSVQFSEPVIGRFCMRTRFELAEGPDTPRRTSADLAGELSQAVSQTLALQEGQLSVRSAQHRTRTVLMVSTADHCLRDLLYRWHAGELAVDISAVVSNHWDLQPVAAQYGVPFVHIPVSKATKPLAEARLLEVLADHDAELVVLARYMQILSDDLCRHLDGRVVNIHHSFLPGFKGARPYHQAWERGVKLIGATAHFVTADLDEGPIIDQDVSRVSHLNDPDDLAIIGRDIERIVLSRAVKAVADHRVFRFADRTVVF